MGLTSNSTGTDILNDNIKLLQKDSDFTIALRWQSKCWKVYYF